MRVLAPHFEGALKKETVDNVEIRRFQYFAPQSSQTVCYQGGALGNLAKNKYNKYKLPFLVLFEWIAILFQTLTWRPNVLNSHWLIPQSFLCSLVSIITRTKHIATVHGGDVFALNGVILKKVKGFAVKQAHSITVNSSVTQEKVEQLVAKSRGKLVRLPTGILPLPDVKEDDVVMLSGSLRQHQDEKLILFVGRLSEEKGVGDAILATQKLLGKGLKIRCVIVGEGHDKQSFIELSKKLDIENNVQFIGWVNNRDLYTYFKSCDVFVGPSKQSAAGWIEAQGLTFVEAMLAGCPVVGSRSGGIPDAVQPDKTGWLCEPDNPEDLAKSIENVLSSDTSEITHYAKKFAEQYFLVSQTAKKFESIMEEVVYE